MASIHCLQLLKYHCKWNVSGFETVGWTKQNCEYNTLGQVNLCQAFLFSDIYEDINLKKM